MDIVYLTFSKSFDTVFHHILIEKMMKCGLDNQARRWIANWLNCWAQRLVSTGMKSNCSPVPVACSLLTSGYTLALNYIINDLAGGIECTLSKLTEDKKNG